MVKNTFLKFIFIWLPVFLSSTVKSQWTPTNGTNGSAFVYCLASHGNYIYAGTQSGLYVSDSTGVFWLNISNGLPGFEVFAIAVDSTGIYAGTNGGGLYFSSNNGSTWQSVNNGITDSIITAILIDSNAVFVGTSGDGIFLSTNNGNTWTPQNSGLTFTHITSIIRHGNVLVTAGNGIYISSDNGTTWNPVGSGLPAQGILCLTATDSSIFAGVDYHGLYKSNDNGISWTVSSTNPFPRSIIVSDTTIYYAHTGGVTQSSDNGNTWSDITGSQFYQLANRSLAVVNSKLFTGTYRGGVYKYAGTGTLWTDVNEGIRGIVNDICFRGLDLLPVQQKVFTIRLIMVLPGIVPIMV